MSDQTTAFVNGDLSAGNRVYAEWLNDANRATYSVLNIAALKALEEPDGDIQVMVRGYYTSGDGGGGEFFWDSASSATADDGLVIARTGQSGAGRWIRVLDQSNKFNILWWGAKRDNATDCSTAAIAMIAAMTARLVVASGGSSTAAQGSAPVGYFPYGEYYASAAFSANVASTLAYFEFEGDNAVIRCASNVTLFGGIAYNVSFRGLQFWDGACAISIKTANVNSAMVLIDQCEFHNQTTACIQSDNNSASTNLVIRNPKIFQRNANANMLKLLSGDNVVVSNGWFQGSCQVAFYLDSVIMKFDGPCCGVPESGMLRWAEQRGNSYLDWGSFRFGGEEPNIVPMRIYTDADTSNPVVPNGFDISNVEVYTNTYVVEFYGLPNIVRLFNLRGLAGTAGLYFDTTLTAADFANFQSYGQVEIVGTVSQTVQDTSLSALVNNATNGLIGAKVFNAMLARDGYTVVPFRDRVQEAEIFGSGGVTIASWSVTSSSNITTGTVTSPYGVDTYEITATAGDGSVQFTKAAYLTVASLTYGALYTLNIFVTAAVTGVARVAITIGGSAMRFNVANTKHRVLTVPFVYCNSTGLANATFDALTITVELPSNGDVVTIGRQIDLIGISPYVNSVLRTESTAAPAGFTSRISGGTGYYRGDVNARTNVAAAGPWGDFNVTAGAPGTWKATANIAA